MRSARRLALVFAVFVMAVVPVAYGQQQTPKLQPIQPYQGPPGARALSLGGAFIAVADDATAAESNPAGLVILTRPEVSLHLVSETGEQEDCPDCESNSSTRPAFASYVHPMGPGVFSVYYQSGLEVGTSFTDQFEDESFSVNDDSKFRRLGVAAGFRPFPMVSIGASVGLNKLTVDRRNSGVFGFETEDELGNTVPAFFEFEDRADVDDTAFSYNVGVLLNPAGRISVGAVYKKGSDFEGDNRFKFRFCEDCAQGDLGSLSFDELPAETVALEAPSLIGGGISVRPFPRALIALDYTSQRSQSVLFSNEDQEIRALRVGAEYVFATGNPNLFIPIRAGWAKENDTNFESSDFFREEAKSYTVGAGIVMGQNQLDIGYLSGYSVPTNDKVRQIIISGIRRF
jgi:long-subunit fatty acid transport protein